MATSQVQASSSKTALSASRHQMESDSFHNSSSSHFAPLTALVVSDDALNASAFSDDVNPTLTMTPSPRPRSRTPPKSSAPEQTKISPTPTNTISSPVKFSSSNSFQDDRSSSLNAVSGPSRIQPSTTTRNASINDSHSPRTSSNRSIPDLTDLAAHYGIPRFLPPTPRTTSLRQESATDLPDSDIIPDQNLLCSNYLAMLSQKPEDPLMEGLSAPSTEDAVNAVLGALGQNLPTFPTPSYGDFLTSPFDDSPFDEPLATPLMGPSDMDLLTSPLLDFDSGTSPDLALFSDMSFLDAEIQKADPPVLPPSFMDDLCPMTPMTPSLDPSSLYPSPRQPAQHLMPSPPVTRRKSSATGTRKNLTPDSLVSLDAPTQPRKYVIPSATSRKDVPAIFAKKRARAVAFGDEEDELEEAPLHPNATEKEQIEWKRRQNTLAARKSRKRKLQHQMELEGKVQLLTQERDMWRTRALTFRDMLVTSGVNIPPFADA